MTTVEQIPIPERPRGKVVPLRGQTAGGVQVAQNLVLESTPMSEMLFDLQPAIDALRSLKCDVEAYYWDHTRADERSQAERYQIAFWLRQLSDRTSALEGIVLHKGATRLVLHDVDGDERQALAEANRVLDRWIHEEETFARVHAVVAAALAAADRIGLRAAGGLPARLGGVPLRDGRPPQS